MSLHDELVDVARALIRRNQSRPTQGDIRRGISTAYYALFHRLIDDGVSRLAVGATQPDALGRAFGHTEMKKICQLILKSPLPPQVAPLFGTPIPLQLKSVAETFVWLQEQRHEADYNRGRDPPFTKADARNALSRVETAFRDWDQVRNAPAAQLFLVLLLLGDRWNRGS